MAFIKSSTSETDMTLDGTDNHHVFIVTGFENDYCHSYQDTSLYKAFYDSTGDIPLGTAEAEIGFKANDFYREVQYLGRYCFTPTGMSSYCTLTDAKFRFIDYTNHMLMVTTQTAYY